MAEKVTIMVLEVDLQCTRCYKKVKKVLCKFPQIRDQVYDEKENRVTIRVVCCNPERMRDKLCCKGGGSIKSIEIREPEKPKPPALAPAQEKKKEPERSKPPPLEPEKKKEPEKPKPPPPELEKKKETEKPKPTPPEPEKNKEAPKPVVVVMKPEKPKEVKPEEPKAKNPDPPKPAPPSHAPAQPIPILPVPEPMPGPGNVVPNPVPFGYPPGYPMGVCCRECYEGYTGPCFHGGYGGCYVGRPVYDSYGGGRSCHTYTSRCDYFSEENASGCRIM